jgi:hypothetical protein
MKNNFQVAFLSENVTDTAELCVSPQFVVFSRPSAFLAALRELNVRKGSSVYPTYVIQAGITCYFHFYWF